jgi:hypothetical protein
MRAAGRIVRQVASTCVLLAGVAAAAVSPCGAASVPAWLDAGISKYNAANPGAEIRFVDIKDSFVWYDMPRTEAISAAQIRERVNSIVLANRYEPMDDEEIVTTGKPPVQSGRSMPKKCWSRSFVLTIQAQSNTKEVGGDPSGIRQRMLTSLVCEDTGTWWAAFRVVD